MKKLLYISLFPHGANDFYYALKKYFNVRLYTGLQDAIDFAPDIIHVHSGALGIDEAFILKMHTQAFWSQFTGDCSDNKLEPVMRCYELFDLTLLTIAEGKKELYKDLKRVEWMPEAVPENISAPKELTDGKIVFVGNYYDHFPQGNERRKICEVLSEAYKDKFEVYGNFNVQGVNCLGTIPYEKTLELYNNAYIVISQDNFTKINRYYTQRYLAAIGTSCCVGMKIDGMAKDFPVDCFFRYNDVNELLKTVEYIYQNPEIRNATAKRGHDVIKQKFTYEKWVERYINLL